MTDMARFQVNVYCLNLGGDPCAERSESGDRTVWAHRSHGQFRLEQVDAAGAVIGAPIALDEARSSRLWKAIETLPPAASYAASGCDGLRCRMVVSWPDRTERYYWWAPDGRRPEVAPVSAVASLLEEFLNSHSGE